MICSKYLLILHSEIVCRKSILIRQCDKKPAKGHPPSNQNSKEMTDKSLCKSTLGLFGPMSSIMSLDFMSAGEGKIQRIGNEFKGQPPAVVTPKFIGEDKYIVMGIDIGVIWATNFNYIIRFRVHRLRVNRLHTKIHGR